MFFYFSDIGTQTSTSLSKNSPRKIHLRNRIRHLRRNPTHQLTPANRNISGEEVVEFVKQHCSPALANFLKAQIEHIGKSKKGSRYSNDYKKFALTIYFLGPKVYKYLSGIFRLPSKSTLFRITRDWGISNGFNDFIFSTLKIKVEMFPEKNRHCILCMDEMSIKSNLFYNIRSDEIIGFHHTSQKTYDLATEALVLMARGINENWKQPLAYFLVSSSCPVPDLRNILIEAIRRLTNIGLNVVTVISDNGGNFHKLIRQLGVTVDTPYFKVDDKQIFYMIDVPHLIKSTRNNFFDHHFEINNGRTSKEYLNTFYSEDKKNRFRLAPKLTDDHLFPNNFKKMKVQLATQIFSSTVAAGLNIYMSFGKISAAAIHTITFIENMDKLFDLFNSSKCGKVKEFQLPFIGTEQQIDFLKKMKDLFRDMKILDKTNKNITNRMKFNKAWQLTISAFLQMWPVLRSNDSSIIYTRRFNQDCLENFFGKIRQASGNSKNPTPIQFQRSFKKLFALGYFEQSEGTNCLEEFDDILVNVTPEMMKKIDTLVSQVPASNPLVIETTDYAKMDITEKNAFTYICGYLIKKCLSRHQCELCLKFAKEHNEPVLEQLYTIFRAYKNSRNDAYGNLICSDNSFIEYIDALENTFINFFPIVSVGNNVGKTIRNHCLTENFAPPCSNFPLQYLICLFVRVRIYYCIKFLNRNLNNFKSKTKKPIQKLLNLQHL